MREEDSWKWQLRNALKGPEELAEYFGHPLPVAQELERIRERLRLGVTPYYAETIRGTVLEKTVLPDLLELTESPGECADPMAEDDQSPLSNLIHRYPNRVLLYLTERCATYCRYCTRARRVGKEPPRSSLDEALAYIEKNPAINEVILSGGDPLLLDDGPLKEALQGLRGLTRIKVIRISSKIPLVLPQRITEGLLEVIRSVQPLYLNLHVIHPAELSPQVKLALDALRSAGAILGAQTVLLKGINEDPRVMTELNGKLLEWGVRPYSLYLCDWIQGAAHFRTDLPEGIRILEHLRAELGGMALPQLIADPKGGKVSLNPANLLEETQEGWWLKNWRGERIFYPKA